MTSAGTIPQTLAIAKITGEALANKPDPQAGDAAFMRWLGTFVKLAYHTGAVDALNEIVAERN